MDSPTLHYANVMAGVIGADGLTDTQLREALERTRNVCERVIQERLAGRFPFADLLYANDTILRIEKFANDRRARYRNIVHIGIGGSALGATALHTALRPLFHNVRQTKEPRLFILDNIDPEETEALLDLVNPKETLYHIVTKSGDTTETIAAFLCALRRLQSLGAGQIRDHVVVTTGMKGSLRTWAESVGVPIFEIPEGVGGRFSVFTAVGLLPAALLAIPLHELLAGAAEMDQICRRTDPKTNTAFMLALIAHLLDTEKQKPIHVVMPYARALRDIGDWFRQLWAESLGKKLSIDGRVIHAGPTPVLALGTTDQHSQIQLYTEGPNDKFVLFIAPERFRSDEKVPGSQAPAMAWLEGKHLSEIMDAMRRGTESALTSTGRPNALLSIPDLSPRSIGALLYLFEMATVFAGYLYGVNPFDQPGVEHGKRTAFAILGRAGFDELRQPLDKLSPPSYLAH